MIVLKLFRIVLTLAAAGYNSRILEDMANPPPESNRDRNRYVAVTHNIRVYVDPEYLQEQSDPLANRYFWAYAVEISNESDKTVQLKERTWVITDGNGEVERVHGPGVVGEQPILNPGDAFQYTSGCPLTTNSGFMVGTCTMQGEDGELFEIDVPAFALDLPDVRRTVN